jgi:hypothetical protein
MGRTDDVEATEKLRKTLESKSPENHAGDCPA